MVEISYLNLLIPVAKKKFNSPDFSLGQCLNWNIETKKCSFLTLVLCRLIRSIELDILSIVFK